MAGSFSQASFLGPSLGTADEAQFELPASPDTETRVTTLTVPAVVEWAENDPPFPRTHCLGYTNTNPVHVVFDLGPTDDSPVTFCLRFVIALRNQRTWPFMAKEALYLFPRSDGYSRLRVVDTPTQGPRGQPQDPGPVRLSVELASPGDLIAPDWPLEPQDRDHCEVLESIRRIAHQSTFTLFVRRQKQQTDSLSLGVPMHDLKALCASVSNREPRPDITPRDLGHLYPGQEAKVIGPDLLSTPITDGPLSRLIKTAPPCDLASLIRSLDHHLPGTHAFKPRQTPSFLDDSNSDDDREVKKRSASASPRLEPDPDSGSGSGAGAVTDGTGRNNVRVRSAREILAEFARLRESMDCLDRRLSRIEAISDQVMLKNEPRD